MEKLTFKSKFKKRNITQILERVKTSVPYLPAILIFCCLLIYLTVTYYNCDGSANIKFKLKKFQNINTPEGSNYLTNPASQSPKQTGEGELPSEKAQAEVDNQTRLDLDNLLNETIVGILDSLEPHQGPTPPPISRFEALSQEREKLRLYTNSLRNNSLPGGRPRRNFIITTWRSGSSFLGEAVTSHPTTFYHYEPLLHFEIVQLRSGKLADEGVRVIQSLLECDYSNLEDYVNYGRSHEFVHSHNPRLWKYCKQNAALCTDPSFLSEMCSIFPVQIIKTVRMRLKLLKPVLDTLQNTFDIRILLLVRDPRGTMHSRRYQSWCNNPDCSEPSRHCADMVQDYEAISELREKYPNQVQALRYEDISLNPIPGVKKVLQFFGLDYDSRIESFIKTHSIMTIGGVSSTFRDSKNTPFKWIDYFKLHKPDTTALDEIQEPESCREAMELWGYNRLEINQKDALHNFKALREPPPWPDMIVPPNEN